MEKNDDFVKRTTSRLPVSLIPICVSLINGLLSVQLTIHMTLTIIHFDRSILIL